MGDQEIYDDAISAGAEQVLSVKALRERFNQPGVTPAQTGQKPPVKTKPIVDIDKGKPLTSPKKTVSNMGSPTRSTAKSPSKGTFQFQFSPAGPQSSKRSLGGSESGGAVSPKAGMLPRKPELKLEDKENDKKLVNITNKQKTTGTQEDQNNNVIHTKDGRAFVKLPLPEAEGPPPKKPPRPAHVMLSFEDDGDEIYDEVVAKPPRAGSVKTPSDSDRPVSEIPEMTEEEEIEFETNDKRPRRKDKSILKTEGLPGGDEQEMYDDAETPKRDDAKEEYDDVYEEFDDTITNM